jgi:predicted transposase/invertase (TIGR01784 family)
MTESERTSEPLNPKVDVVFKALFGQPGNMDLVADLLNGLLELEESERIVSVELLPSLGELETTEEKLTILDLYVEDARGRRYGVEMQCRNHKAFAERMLYYAAKRYTRRLRSAEAYPALRPLVLVVITDFVLFEQLELWRERFELRGQGRAVLFSPHLAIVLVQLPRFHKTAAEASSLGELWTSFLKEGTQMGTDILSAPWATPALRKAVEELRRLEGDEQMRELYEARLDQVRVLATELESSFEEGRDEGRNEGRNEGRGEGRDEAAREIARRLLARGQSPEDVASITGLSLDVIRTL